MLKQLNRVGLAVVSCVVVVTAQAWDHPGHMTSAGIAYVEIERARPDLPGRYMKNMGQGGCRYLMKQGVWYANANYRRAWLADVRSHALFPGIGNDLARKVNWAGPRRIRGRSAGSVRN